MVGRRQTRQAQFVITGIAAELARAFADELGAALTEWAVELARLAEAAAAHAAAQHFDTGAVLHGTDQRHHKVFGRLVVVHIFDDRLGDTLRHAGAVGLDGFDAAILFIRHIVERRDVNAGDLRHFQQQPIFCPALLFALLDSGADVLQHLLTLAQLHDIEEISHRLGIADAGAARDDERPAGVTVRRAQRDARQAQHSQNIGVAKLVFQREADDVKIRQRVLAFEAVERDIQPFHLLFHVGPGHECALTPPVFVAVEDIVQNLFAQEGHADLVGIREAERHTDVDFGLIFIDAARLAAGVAARFLDQAQCFFEFGRKFRHYGEPSLWGFAPVLPVLYPILALIARRAQKRHAVSQDTACLILHVSSEKSD